MLRNDIPHRFTLGVLPGWMAYEGLNPDRYLSQVFGGIRARAKERGCHLLLAWGAGRVVEGSRAFPVWPVVAPDSDFVPVGPWNTDGLIVLAPLLNPARSAYLQKISAKGSPVLFVAAGEKGPAVICDNRDGMRQSVTHLVQHGHHQIAFIAGAPNDHGDSAERYYAYLAAIQDSHPGGFEVDPRLVAFGHHTYQGGRAAMWEILNRKIEFTAVQASNDLSAIGAMRALREAGFHIPQDVAVAGFDDQTDALVQIPALTSVHVPLAELGAAAVDQLLDHLEKGKPLQTTVIPTRLVRRQSCGCLPAAMLGAASCLPVDPDSAPAPSDDQLAAELSASLPAETRVLCASLVSAFRASLAAADTGPFAAAMLQVLQELEQNGASLAPYQDVLSGLRNAWLAHPAAWPVVPPRLAEDLIHQARAALAESLERLDQRHRFTAETQAYRLNLLTSSISSSLDPQRTVQLLSDQLPSVGIAHARLVLFETVEDDPTARSRVITAATEPDSPHLRFRTRRFPSRGLYPPDELLSLALVPLVFQNQPLGYVAFEAGDLTAAAEITLQLAAGLKAAQLHTEVVELSILDPLTALYNRRFLELFLRKEVERCHRYHRGLAALMIDVDHFKTYNDTFGHPAGDVILQQLAHRLQEHQRKLDIVARYGGDEFTVILPETDQAGALIVAEGIRATLEELFSTSQHLTVSLGLAVMRTNEYSAEELLQNADRALYVAKRTGKNRVSVYKEK